MLLETVHVLHAVIPQFLRMLDDLQIKESEEAHFSCEVYPDDIPVKWYLNGTQISPSDKYFMLVKGPKRHIYIKDIAKADEGRVSVMIGDNLKSSADLSVEGRHTGWGFLRPLSAYPRQRPR